MASPPTLQVAVVIERLTQPTRWEEWRHRIADVVVDHGEFGSTPKLLRDDGEVRTELHPGLPVSLFKDEAEGYHLNLTTDQPVWFVLWRIDDDDPSGARPELVTLSYNEAGRWLDAQERVDNRPLPPEVCAWLQAFAEEHYKPEPRQRKRPASFRPPEER